MATDGASAIPSPADELNQLRQEVELLRAERQQWFADQQRDARTIAQLQHQLQQLLRRLYGRSSEKIDPQQLVLFEQLMQELQARQGEPAPTPANDATPPAAETSKPKNNGRQGHGRSRLPAHLERETILHDLPEDQKPCPCCGQMRHVIGRQVSEQLEYVPARVRVIEHVQLTYACRTCEQNAAESGSQVVTAQKPASPVDKCLAAPGLLAHVIVSKYGDHQPLYRLERIFERLGIDLARSTMCAWMAQCAGVLRPLYDRMKTRVLQSKVIHTDDTPVEVLEPGRGETRTGRFWVYLGDADHPFTLFDYTPSRRRDGPMQFLAGWGQDRRVYLQADAFGGYDGIYAGQAGGQVTEVACWAHARRKFFEARHADAVRSTRALAYIRLLYDLEDRAKAECAPQDKRAESGALRPLSAVRHSLRQTFALPRLEEFRTWLTEQQAERGGPVLPKSPMGEAIGYALNQWDALCIYTTDGDLAIDNNASENAVRPVALGRKNWLFAGSDQGGTTAATLFSLLATCHRHQVEPFAYLRDILTRIAETPPAQYDQFLNDRWKAAGAA